MRTKPPLRQRRSEALKAEILAAARELFARDGYEKTSMVGIAEAAGVAVQTVYSRLGGKAMLLRELLGVIDRGAKVSELQERIATSNDPREILELTAGMRRRLMEETGDIVRVLMASMVSNGDVAGAWGEAMEKSKKGSERIARRLQQLKALRAGLDVQAARDILYTMLHPALYLRLVDECRWPPQKFEAWLADTLVGLLL